MRDEMLGYTGPLSLISLQVTRGSLHCVPRALNHRENAQVFNP